MTTDATFGLLLIAVCIAWAGIGLIRHVLAGADDVPPLGNDTDADFVAELQQMNRDIDAENEAWHDLLNAVENQPLATVHVLPLPLRVIPIQRDGGAS